MLQHRGLAEPALVGACLADQLIDRRHSTFSNLACENGWLPELAEPFILQIFCRAVNGGPLCHRSAESVSSIVLTARLVRQCPLAPSALSRGQRTIPYRMALFFSVGGRRLVAVGLGATASRLVRHPGRGRSAGLAIALSLAAGLFAARLQQREVPGEDGFLLRQPVLPGPAAGCGPRNPGRCGSRCPPEPSGRGSRFPSGPPGGPPCRPGPPR